MPVRQSLIEFGIDALTDEFQVGVQRRELLAGNDIDAHVGAGDDGGGFANSPDERDLAEVSACLDFADLSTAAPYLRGSAQDDDERAASLAFAHEHGPRGDAEPNCHAGDATQF
jgi:hypothetical protein